MRKHNIYLLLGAMFILSACAVAKQQAPIEYHHDHSNIGGSRAVNENTIEIISNDGEVITSDLKDSEATEVIEPNNNKDENFIIPEKVQAKKLPKKEEVTLKENDLAKEIEEIEEVMPKPQKITTQVEEEPKKQLQTESQAPAAPAAPPAPVDYINPVDGKIITKFGEKTDHGVNKGINIAAPEGTKIVSSASGKVIYSDYDATFGNLVIVKLDNKNIVISYAHLEDLMVSKGSSIKQGEIIGYVGSTGKVKQPQLHFAMREGKNAIDPLKFLHY